MKINSAQVSLSLALRALEKRVAPGVMMKSARDAVANISLVPKDLLRREGEGIAFLKRYIEEGETLFIKVKAILGHQNNTPSTKASPSSLNQDFESFVAIHEELTQRLDGLVIELAKEKPVTCNSGKEITMRTEILRVEHA